MNRKKEIDDISSLEKEIIIDSNEIEDDNLIDNIILRIDEKDYTYSELIDLINNNYKELSLYKIKEIKRKINNYVTSFIYCVYKAIKTNKNVKQLKADLIKNQAIYNTIDIACSNQIIKFDKGTVDDVIKIYEKIFFE